MNRRELLEILKILKVPLEECKWLSEVQVQIPCPLAPWFHESKHDFNPSMGIRLGDAKAWTVFRCFTCDESGKLAHLVVSLASLDHREDLNDLIESLFESDAPSLAARFKSLDEETSKWFYDIEDKSKDTSYSLARFEDLHLSRRACEYLKGRGISDDIATQFDLRHDPHLNRVVFPVRSEKGELQGAVGRTLLNEVPPYYNYFSFPASETLGGADHIVGNPRILLVEGYFDLLNCWQWAQEIETDVVCCWKATLSKKQIEFLASKDATIYVGFDPGKAGRTGWNKALKELEPYTTKLQKVEVPEDSDIGELTKATFLDIMEQAQRRARIF